MHAISHKCSIVLIGVGHTNAHILRMWRIKPIANTRLLCISDYPFTAYSGMLPGVLAGQYDPEEMKIDLVKLCRAAEAELILEPITQIVPDQCEIHFDRRSPVTFNVLSLGIGSAPTMSNVHAEPTTIVSIKPMQTFLARFEKRLAELANSGGKPIDVTIVGGGVAGCEIAFCVLPRLEKASRNRSIRVSLINAAERIAHGVAPKTEALILRNLKSRGIEVVLGERVTRITDTHLSLASGRELASDIVLWATGASPVPLLDSLALPKDNDGFLLTRPNLQTTENLPIFAVGDCGTIKDLKLPKAGVHAVREGPILWNNIRNLLRGKPLTDYRPQQDFLKLVNTGDGSAIAEYKGLSFQGWWCWRLKDFIDRRFIKRYQN